MYRRIDPFRRTVLNVPGSAEYCRRDVELCLESAIEGRLGAVSDDCGDLIDFGRAGAKMIGGKVEPPWMFTGNSESRSTFYPIMRIVGAAARELLVQVAAKRLNIDATNLVVRDGIIANQASGRKLRFGALAGEAATRPVPEAPRLKSNSELKLIGRPLARLDVPGKTDGSAVFGIDVRVPGMAIAAIRRAPSPGGKLVSYDRSRILARKGVIATVEIASELAVVADRYWTAKRALGDGKLVFAAGRLANYSTEAQRADYMQRLASGEFMIKKKSGDAAPYLASADGVISAVYEIPVQAHATMEPMNCTAHVTADRCELWAPTQGMEIAHAVAKQITGLPDDRIIIHRTLLGGGFGRRLLADFVRVAIETAQAAGRPVKVIWSREEDFTYDAFRPPMTHAVRAHLGADQLPTVMGRTISFSRASLMSWRMRQAATLSPIDCRLQARIRALSRCSMRWPRCRNGRAKLRRGPLSMGWEGLSPSLRCIHLKDSRRNGGRSGAAVIEHLHTPLVTWAWSPGTDAHRGAREPPPVSHAKFMQAAKTWLATGSVCPKEAQ